MRRASVVGLGVIGGSIAKRLKRDGWTVFGSDQDERHAQDALDRGVIDESGYLVDAASEIVFVAVPPAAVARVSIEVLENSDCPVTDVASVKQEICRLVVHPMFVPGHPMAGSELLRLDGASASLFEGAPWILTPPLETDESALDAVTSAIVGFGATVRILSARRHDEIMAAVSHTPHLLATTLVNSAFSHEEDREWVANLAGGGFRDMTRVASSDPSIWLDICVSNSIPIQAGLRDLAARLTSLADTLSAGDHEVLRRILAAELGRARRSRDLIPKRAERSVHLSVEGAANVDQEIVSDTCERLGADIRDSYFRHGLLHIVLAESQSQSVSGALTAQGYYVNEVM